MIAWFGYHPGLWPRKKAVEGRYRDGKIGQTHQFNLVNSLFLVGWDANLNPPRKFNPPNSPSITCRLRRGEVGQPTGLVIKKNWFVVLVLWVLGFHLSFSPHYIIASFLPSLLFNHFASIFFSFYLSPSIFAFYKCNMTILKHGAINSCGEKSTVLSLSLSYAATLSPMQWCFFLHVGALFSLAKVRWCL